MVKLVGHALLLCCICLDVDNISNAVWNQKVGNIDMTMLCASQISFYTAEHKWAICVPLKFLLNI